ncbi:MAG: hypothetical protein JTJ18_11115 [Streptococcus sp.]|nr:hypothetical protein [Streptococcus sp.]MBS5045469.1 hypothetical protein [Streptococcus parasanguinis]
MENENILLLLLNGQIEDRKKEIAGRFYDSLSDLSKLVTTLKLEGLFLQNNKVIYIKKSDKISDFEKHGFNILCLGESNDFIEFSFQYPEGREINLPKKLISLDLNILIDLGKLWNNTYSGNSEDFFQFLEFIKSEYEIDITSALHENSQKIIDFKNSKHRVKVKTELLAYKQLCKADISQIRKLNDVHIDIDDKIDIDNQLSNLFSEKLIPEYKRLLVVQCLFLKAYILNYNSSKEPKDKINDLINYSLCELKVFSDYELLLIYWYFQDKQVTRSAFRKMKPKKKTLNELVNDICNTAWDIFHFRNLEDSFVSSVVKNDLIATCFASRDKQYREFLNLNPILFIVIQDETYLPWRKFRLQVEVEISEENWKEYSSNESERIKFQKNSEYSYLEEIKKSLIKEIKKIHD